MFNVGQFPASILSNLNYELYSEPSFPAPQLYLLRQTLTIIIVYKNHFITTMPELQIFYFVKSIQLN